MWFIGIIGIGVLFIYSYVCIKYILIKEELKKRAKKKSKTARKPIKKRR